MFFFSFFFLFRLMSSQRYLLTILVSLIFLELFYRNASGILAIIPLYLNLDLAIHWFCILIFMISRLVHLFQSKWSVYFWILLDGMYYKTSIISISYVPQSSSGRMYPPVTWFRVRLIRYLMKSALQIHHCQILIFIKL